MKRVIFLFFVLVEISWCRPRFIAIPIEDVEFLEKGEFSKTISRVPRKIEEPAPEYPQEPVTDENRFERQANGGHEYVDYGAHTGHHGSFGWYADFPVHKGS